MKDRRSFRPTLAVGSLTAAVALLAGMNLANAQAPAPSARPLSGAGSFPQSFIVPGTNTSLHVGGQVQIDLDYSFDNFGGSSSVGAYDNLSPGSVGVEGPGAIGATGSLAHTNEGVLRFTPANTKLFTETRTPTAYGEMKTYIEFDFQGGQATQGAASTGSTTVKLGGDGVPRLRQAYGTLGPWLFGDAISNYADLAALADTLDSPVEAGNYMGAGTFRQTQIRYTYLLPMGITTSVSMESAFSGALISATNTGAGAVTANDFNSPGISSMVPAFTAKAAMQQPWGHAAFALAVMQERYDNNFQGGTLSATIPNGGHFKRWGYQLLQSGHLNTFGKDKLTWSIGYGQGAAQYSWPLASTGLGTNWEEGMVCSVTGTAASGQANSYACSEPRVLGVNVGYDHFWTNEWRSGVAFGWDTESRPNAAGAWTQSTGVGLVGAAGLAKLEHRHLSVGASLFWTPVANVQFGATWIWYHREVWSGARGNAQRLETQALFRF